MIRVGVIVPSLNAMVEEVTPRLLGPYLDQLSVHYSRLPTRFHTPSEGYRRQFDTDRIAEAAALLEQIEPDLLLWNGSSGGSLGTAADRAVKSELTVRFGVPVTTTVLAVVCGLRSLGIRKFALVTPYLTDQAAEYEATLVGEGFVCTGNVALECEDATQMSLIERDEIVHAAREACVPGTEGVLLVCTNFPGAYVVEELEQELGVPVIDSTLATVWHGLRLARLDVFPEGWGTLLRASMSADGGPDGD